MVTQQSRNTLEFAFFRPGAQSVCLIGDFNGWRAGITSLRGDGLGWWRTRVTLPTGEHRFRYLIDNAWCEADFAAFGVEREGDGEWTSVLWVRPGRDTEIRPQPASAEESAEWPEPRIFTSGRRGFERQAV